MFPCALHSVVRMRVPGGKGGGLDVDVDVVEDEEGPREMTVPSMSEQGTRAGEPCVMVAWWP